MKSCSPFRAGHHLHDTVLYRNYQANFHIYNIFYQKPTVPSSSSHQSEVSVLGALPRLFPVPIPADFGSGSTGTAQPSLSCNPVTPTQGWSVQSSNLNHLCPVNITMKSRYNPRAEHSQSAPAPPPHQLLHTKISVTIQRPKGYLLSIYYNFFLAGFSM